VNTTGVTQLGNRKGEKKARAGKDGTKKNKEECRRGGEESSAEGKNRATAKQDEGEANV